MPYYVYILRLERPDFQSGSSRVQVPSAPPLFSFNINEFHIYYVKYYRHQTVTRISFVDFKIPKQSVYHQLTHKKMLPKER